VDRPRGGDIDRQVAVEKKRKVETKRGTQKRGKARRLQCEGGSLNWWGKCLASPRRKKEKEDKSKTFRKRLRGPVVKLKLLKFPDRKRFDEVRLEGAAK